KRASRSKRPDSPTSTTCRMASKGISTTTITAARLAAGALRGCPGSSSSGVIVGTPEARRASERAAYRGVALPSGGPSRLRASRNRRQPAVAVERRTRHVRRRIRREEARHAGELVGRPHPAERNAPAQPRNVILDRHTVALLDGEAPDLVGHDLAHEQGIDEHAVRRALVREHLRQREP